MRGPHILHPTRRAVPQICIRRLTDTYQYIRIARSMGIFRCSCTMKSTALDGLALSPDLVAITNPLS